MRVWPWASAAGAALTAVFAVAGSTGSVVVGLGGGFLATQLFAPVLFGPRIVRSAPSARHAAAARNTVRPGAGGVAWVRLDRKTADASPAARLVAARVAGGGLR
jgi:hypothetical protein